MKSSEKKFVQMEDTELTFPGSASEMIYHTPSRNGRYSQKYDSYRGTTSVHRTTQRAPDCFTPKRRHVRVCEDKMVCEKKKVCHDKVCQEKPQCESPCAEKSNHRSGWKIAAIAIGVFIVVAFLIWLALYFWEPNFILDEELNTVDYPRAIFCAVIFAFIVIVLLGIAFALFRNRK